MEVYTTEQEQIDAIKKWWKENGKAVVIGAILGFGSLIGWQQWQANAKAKAEGGSLEFTVLMTDLQQGNYQGVKDRGARVLNDFQNTPYAVMTALALAKVYVDEGDLASAKSYLQRVMDQTDMPEYQQVARLRMGRLLLAEEQPQQALALLSGVDVAGFEAIYDELRGDIQVALGNRDEARQAYERALAAMTEGLDPSALKMKLDDLGGAEARS